MTGRLSFTALIIVLTVALCNAQAPTFQWAKQLGGTQSDAGYSVRTDAAGNVFTAGYFQGTADFDPGPGTFNLTSAGSWDIFVSKIDASGNFLWAKAMGGAGSEVGNSIAIDGSGNIFTAGFFDGMCDFDPGAGIFNLTSAGNSDIFISKLDASGNFVWAKKIGGTGNDYGYSAVVDAAGNVYTTGFFSATVDFNPNAGVFNLTSSGIGDIFISKLDASGNFVWAKKMGGISNDVGYSITADASGNIYSTGIFFGTVDFDPGAGVFALTSAGSIDIFISKLDASGNFVLAKQMGGSAIDYGYSITVDNAGNIYTTGNFDGTADFDPGAGTFNLTSFGFADIFVSKLDGSGNFVWAKQMAGTGIDDGQSITTDPAGNVYTTGSFDSAPCDFDPGPGTYTLSSSGGRDIFVNKLNSSGNLVWSISMGGSASTDIGRSITLNAAGNIHTTGYFQNTVDFDPGGGTFNLISTGNDEIFLQKLDQCITPSQPVSINGGTNICSGTGATTFSVTQVFGATSYTWTLPNTWTGTSTTNIINATPGSSGVFSVIASSSCGISPQQTLMVTVNPLPTITVNSGSICSGQSFTMIPGGASTYTFSSGPVVSPIINTSYSVTGTSSSGCISSNTAVSNVTVHATPTISVNSGSICSGSSFTIVPSGASTYTFSSGPVVSPNVNTSYSVTGTSSAGCISSNTAVSNVNVHATPTISVNSGSICNGQSFTITPNGASTYTIQGGNAVVSPSTTSSYTVTGTSTAGCMSLNTATSNVTVNPLPSISASSSTNQLCIGSSATLTASGGNTYTWNPGGPGSTLVISPVINTTYTINGTDANGCSNTNTITQVVINCGTSGLNELKLNHMDIYPNPFNDKIMVIIPSTDAEILVFNTIGELVFKGLTENGKLEIDLSKETSGVYFIRTGTITKKIIKQ